MQLIEYEKKLWDRGLSLIAGVDEAGRGPLAGPIVAAAVILNKSHTLNPRNNDVYSQINDSKKLSPKKRVELREFIVQNAYDFAIVEIFPEEIDEIGIGKANKLAFINCVRKLSHAPEHVLTDFFTIKELPTKNQTNIKRGDTLSISIAAASILAKTHRDKLMLEIHEKHPDYGFDRHKGYGTKFHFEMIEKFGVCEAHRKSFAGVKGK